MSEALKALRTTNKAVKTFITATCSAGTVFHVYIIASYSLFHFQVSQVSLHSCQNLANIQNINPKGETRVAVRSCGLPKRPGPAFENRGIFK